MPELALGCLGVPYIWIRPAYVRPENVPEANVRASLFHNRSLDTERPAKVPAVARGGRGMEGLQSAVGKGNPCDDSTCRQLAQVVGVKDLQLRQL